VLGPVVVPDFPAMDDLPARETQPGSGSQTQPHVDRHSSWIAKKVSGIRSGSQLLPWLIAGALAFAVFAGIYSYRQTARFAARAAGGHAAKSTTPPTPSPEVQDLYLKGRYYWSKRNPDDLNKAVDYFTQAIVKDPNYAAPFVGLADSYNLLREFSSMPPDQAFPRALAAAQKAVDLDDSSAEAHNSLAFATFYWNWDAPTAEHEFKRALRLNPNFVQGRHWYATFLLAIERFPEAVDQIELARKLDPSSNSILADKGLILWRAGMKDEAVALLKQLEASDPTLASPHQYMAQVFFETKNYRGYIAELKRAAQLRNDRSALAVAEAAERGYAAGGLRGMRQEMLPVQEKFVAQGDGSPFDLALTYAALGRNDDALRCLEAALDKRELRLLFLDENLEFNALHDDPAYREILAKVQARLPKPVPQHQ